MSKPAPRLVAAGLDTRLRRYSTSGGGLDTRLRRYSTSGGGLDTALRAYSTSERS